MTHIFDGRAAAKEIEVRLLKKVTTLKSKGITPKLVSIVIGDEEGALMYQRMKQKAAERIGGILEIVQFAEDTELIKLIELIQKLNTDNSVHGIMIQLPLPSNFSSEDREQIIQAINPKKDVDGLLDNTNFVTPVVRAILVAFDDLVAMKDEKEVVVLGAAGFVGKKTVTELESRSYSVIQVDKSTENYNEKIKSANALICTTNSPEFVTQEMLNEGVSIIDIGAPVGNVKKDAYSKCSFVTPVPGGIGPVTIACLMENLVVAAQV
jgi:methylenetetrahydrofolate dehydrogenase (NADP+) / methenyltetrahydrofolate cyclohydrolase